ncbi:MAG TPA: hypothetical protein VMS55_01195 [Myxococcota bacterium]|nr:hypothetical protein [Myxococcota bacterium]
MGRSNSGQRRKARKRRTTKPSASLPEIPSVQLAPVRACALPLSLALALAAFGLFPSVRDEPRLFWSLEAAAGALVAWTLALLASAVRSGGTFALELSLRRQHYLQACAQGAVFLYWGWYWPRVYESAPLLGAQLLFAYAAEALLTWSRRGIYVLGFGLFPVVFSINLFLWFRPDWFYLQFLMVAAAIAGKQWIRWERDGRRVHIFNPSALALALFSLGLLATGTTHTTWGQDIALTQFYPPHMYLMLFLVGLPGQTLFGVSPMTMAAALTTYLFGLLYLDATGVYFFYDSYIPIALFLGMILLFTDPSTSPRTELGRLVFGALYGISTVVLYEVLWRAGLPTFYDKLLQVPLMNLSVRWLDRIAPRAVLGRSLAPGQRNIAYVSVWAIVFAIMSAEQGVGDLHPGQWLPFWQRACAERRHGACEFLLTRQLSHCDHGSGWACNEAGRLRLELLASDEGRVGREVAETIGPLAAPALAETSQVLKQLAVEMAIGSLERGCQLGFEPSCENLRRVAAGNPLVSAEPALDDYPIVLQGSKLPVRERAPSELYALACREGWPDACDP